MFGPSPTLQTNWPSATDSTTADPDYEVVGPQIFRFEYFYQLTDGTFANNPGANINSVSSISVCIAMTDPRSKVLLSNSQLSTISAKLIDYSNGTGRGALITSWQSVLDTDPTIAALPRASISNIHLYERDFTLR